LNSQHGNNNTNDSSLEITDRVESVKAYLMNLQLTLCKRLSEIDGQEFIRDQWVREMGGGGISTVLEQGHIIEKAGVNFSHVMGDSLPPSASAQRPELAGRSFQALGVSLVVHPRNPYVPTTHMNVRFFIAEKENEPPVWWFGGGYDLTPYYGFKEDCRHWHQTIKNTCDDFDSRIYPKYKKWCDEYFYLPHRDEPRGIGGLFFDDLNASTLLGNTSTDKKNDQAYFSQCFNFTQAIGDSFIQAYEPIMLARKDSAYEQRQRDFQLYRRGRYVEFNLVQDRGTLFGLQSRGRTESILMSMPPLVSWQYDWHPEPNSEEDKLYRQFLVAKDWLA